MYTYVYIYIYIYTCIIYTYYANMCVISSTRTITERTRHPTLERISARNEQNNVV